MRPGVHICRSAAPALLALAMLVCGCGSSGGPPTAGTAASSTTAPGSPSARVTASPADGGEGPTLTSTDAGSTRDVAAGATIRVQLSADPGYHWSAPATSDQTVLQTMASTATAGGADAEFRARRPGTAHVTATEDPTCLPSCGRPSRLWEVTVIVTPTP